MTAYKQPFDAKAYWATKPICSVCKNHKVKNGTICYECKKNMNVEPIRFSSHISKRDISIPLCGIKTSLLAERGGFEPPVRLLVHTLSKRARSTTLPPLR